MNADKQHLLRSLPSVTALLELEEVRDWLSGLPRSTVLAALQTALNETRQAILEGKGNGALDTHDILRRCEEEIVRRSTPSLRRVINATGVVLHTGLGRAPLCDAAIEAIVEGASGYCNLEFDLATGRRGHRSDHIADVLTAVTGAEAATVVNNNAAATVLILGTFAAGREVIVSRGQLIEIGGSFRLPDIMSASSATLREVGTTNRTRLSDYESAISDRTAMLLKVHPSNYRVVGFTEEVGIAELVTLARKADLVAVDDLGSGVLFDPVEVGLPDEPNVKASLAAGADLVCFSGDKLLGGPQCGIILGKKALIDRIEKNPLMRAFRVDKLTLLALEATLRHYHDTPDALVSVPTLAMLKAAPDELANRARALQEELQSAMPAEHFFVCSDVGFAGGGSMPGQELPTVVVQWRPQGRSVDEVMTALHTAETPVVARVRDETVVFDLRTLRPVDIEPLVAAVAATAWHEDDDSCDSPGDGISLPIL